MKNIAIFLMACVPFVCSAAGKTASTTMQVSFTITESCNVQSAGKQAQVSCAHDTPYQLQAKAAAAQAATQSAAQAAAQQATRAADGEPVVVYF